MYSIRYPMNSPSNELSPRKLPQNHIKTFPCQKLPSTENSPMENSPNGNISSWKTPPTENSPTENSTHGNLPFTENFPRGILFLTELFFYKLSGKKTRQYFFISSYHTFSESSETHRSIYFYISGWKVKSWFKTPTSTWREPPGLREQSKNGRGLGAEPPRLKINNYNIHTNFILFFLGGGSFPFRKFFEGGVFF